MTRAPEAGAAQTVCRFVAAGFGTGYAPYAPGTVASFAAVLVAALLLAVSPWLLALAALLATFGGYLAVRTADVPGDPAWVVIDEFAGMWIAALALSHPGPWGLAAAFLLFRLFDITKLGPIGWADRRHGAIGIMADDVVAGAIAALLLVAARVWHPAWF